MDPARTVHIVFRLARLLAAALALLAAAQTAQAVSCATFSSPGWSLTYDPFAAVAATTTSTVNLTCTRQTGDPRNVTLTITANSGLNPGAANQALLAGSGALLQYGNYTDAADTLVWNSGGNSLSITLSFGGIGSTASGSVPFDANIPAGQSTLPPSARSSARVRAKPARRGRRISRPSPPSCSRRRRARASARDDRRSC